jgi:hypothetical protein
VCNRFDLRQYIKLGMLMFLNAQNGYLPASLELPAPGVVRTKALASIRAPQPLEIQPYRRNQGLRCFSPDFPRCAVTHLLGSYAA